MNSHKTHTTNYHNTFIEVADDCKASEGTIPPVKNDKKTVASIQFEFAIRPYQFTSDEILFRVHAIRRDLTPEEYEAAKLEFFSKGQPCFRASPLTKQYGWGVHFDKDGKVALYGRETEEYRRFIDDPAVLKVKAMRSSR